MTSRTRHRLTSLVQDTETVEGLADRFSTPLYAYDGNRLRQNVTRFDRALSASFQKYAICYALKANTNPHLLAEMKSALPRREHCPLLRQSR